MKQLNKDVTFNKRVLLSTIAQLFVNSTKTIIVKHFVVRHLLKIAKLFIHC